LIPRAGSQKPTQHAFAPDKRRLSKTGVAQVHFGLAALTQTAGLLRRMSVY
jgi:hypothetical protein